jgi:hypothetical protein
MDPDALNQARNVLEILVIVGAVIAGAWRIRAGIDKRGTDLEIQMAHAESERDAILNELETLKVSLSREFGGNSGGMREAINRISITVDALDVKSNALSVEIGELRGRFDQHMSRM